MPVYKGSDVAFLSVMMGYSTQFMKDVYEIVDIVDSKLPYGPPKYFVIKDATGTRYLLDKRQDGWGICSSLQDRIDRVQLTKRFGRIYFNNDYTDYTVIEPIREEVTDKT